MFSFLRNFFKALFFTSGPKYSPRKAFCVILGSCAGVFLLSFGFYFILLTLKHSPIKKEAPIIQAIVQTGSQNTHSGLMFTPLASAFLAEILDLSVNIPSCLSQFDLMAAHQKLLATHVIENVRMKKMKPNLLFIDYTLREPWVLLEDYTNTAVDRDGFFFPLTPCYSPRTLPNIYLGEHAPSSPWGKRMPEEFLSLAHTLYSALPSENIVRIDFSQAKAMSAGKREIVLLLKGGSLLRVMPKNCVQQLELYSMLKTRSLIGAQTVVDLRIPEVAYIQKLKSDD